MKTAPSYQQLRTMVFRDHPFHCEDCGTELMFRSPNYKLYDPSRVMVKGFYKNSLCRICYANRITNWFANPIKDYHITDREVGKCEVCGELDLTASIIWDEHASSRFGTNSWNGSHICCDCLTNCILTGKIDTEISSRRGSSNELGVIIDLDTLTVVDDE
jgi:hypothetical protein